MKTLNKRRCELLKSEKIAVENTGDVDLLQGIFKHTHPLDWRTVKGLSKYYYGDVAADTLPDGYTAHPISWFYEQDEAVQGTGVCDYKPVIGAFVALDPKRESPHPKPIPEYVKVVRFKYEAIWYKEKIGQVFKVEKGEDDHYYVTFNETKNFFIIHKSDCIPCDDNGNALKGEPQSESEIIGWALGVDIPTWAMEKGIHFTRKEKGTHEIIWHSKDNRYLPESVLQHIALPIYKRTTAQIIHDLVCGRISEDEAVKLIETKN